MQQAMQFETLPPMQKLRNLCKELYPRQYRHFAKRLSFPGLNYDVSCKIHEIRDIDDLEVEYERVLQILASPDTEFTDPRNNKDSSLLFRLLATVGIFLGGLFLPKHFVAIMVDLCCCIIPRISTSILICRDRQTLLMSLYWDADRMFYHVDGIFNPRFFASGINKSPLIYDEEGRLADKQVLMMYLHTAPRFTSLPSVAPFLLADNDVLRIAIAKGNSLALPYAKKNPEMLKGMISVNPSLYWTLDATTRQDPDLALEAIWYYNKQSILSSELFRDNYDFVMRVLKIDGLLLEEISEELKNDENIVRAAIQQTGYAIFVANPRFLLDREFAKLALQNGVYPSHLEPYFPNITDDAELMMHAMIWSPNAFRQISSRLRQIRAFQQLGTRSDFFWDTMGKGFNDRTLIKLAIKENPNQVARLEQQFLNDEEIVQWALQNDGNTLQFVNKRFQEDRNYVKLAMKSWPYALQYASLPCRQDSELVGRIFEEYNNSTMTFPELKFEHITSSRWWMLKLIVFRNPKVVVLTSGRIKNCRWLRLIAIWMDPYLQFVKVMRYDEERSPAFPWWFALLIMMVRLFRFWWMSKQLYERK